MFSSLFTGRADAEQMVDRYDLACRCSATARGRPARAAARHRLQHADQPATALALWFGQTWRTATPAPAPCACCDIAAAWKQRIRVKTVRAPGGRARPTRSGKVAADILITVRSFYLDLSQWALDDPARWGPWAVPCPIRADDVQYRKMASRRKARMDQRTRERLPALPAQPPPSPGTARTPPRAWMPPAPRGLASCSPRAARRCAAPRSGAARRAPGPRTRRPAGAATSPGKRTTPSGAGSRSRCCG